MPIKQWKEKLLFSLGYAVLIGSMVALQIPCVFHYFLHIPCPGCGMTRAWLAAFRLDFQTAFEFHPMFWSLPVLYAYFLFDGGILRHKTLDRILLCGIALGFGIQWLCRLILG